MSTSKGFEDILLRIFPDYTYVVVLQSVILKRAAACFDLTEGLLDLVQNLYCFLSGIEALLALVSYFAEVVLFYLQAADLDISWPEYLI